MAEKFKNKYRIPTARLHNWDYGSNGAYFITICTQNREHFFGEILDNCMQLNELGQLAEKFWLDIPNRFPFIELGEFVVMPNHTHGILTIDKTDTGGDGPATTTKTTTTTTTVETRLIASLPPQPEMPPSPQPQQPPPPQTEKNGGFSGTKNPMFHENISRIIRWYKGRCSFEMRKIHADFAWQARFHDHIIRNETSFQRISNYIRQNTMKWKQDKFFGEM